MSAHPDSCPYKPNANCEADEGEDHEADIGIEIPRQRGRIGCKLHDESDSAENFELPGADLSGEELSVRVIPKQADEFTCSSCFLVHHRSRLASEKNGVMICTDCAA